MSSRINFSLIDLKSLEKQKISTLFSSADQLALNPSAFSKGFGKTGALLFFEPSTRTRMSFETACARLGVYPLLLNGKAGTSLEKGEDLHDTILNVAAMNPSFLIVRSGDDLDLAAVAEKVSCPILNAGWGKKGHPTQALLDAYTVRKHLGDLQGQKFLIIGDARHSRVAQSHIELAPTLGYELAFCGPQEFLPTNPEIRTFQSLSEGLQWATVAMALRVQLERHSAKYSLEHYRENFGLNQANLKPLSTRALILHPGPINQGTEMDADVLKDPRCQVLDQVGNGVLVRQALLLNVLSEGEL